MDNDGYTHNENGWQMKIHQFDLNLLVALHALLAEQSVTGAAARLSVSQPAMSATLSRLRTALGDPLLERQGRRMVRTPFASTIQKSRFRCPAGHRRHPQSGAQFRPADGEPHLLHPRERTRDDFDTRTIAQSARDPRPGGAPTPCADRAGLSSACRSRGRGSRHSSSSGARHREGARPSRTHTR